MGIVSFEGFSIGIQKKVRSNHYLLLLPIFPDLEMTQSFNFGKR